MKGHSTKNVLPTVTDNHDSLFYFQGVIAANYIKERIINTVMNIAYSKEIDEKLPNYSVIQEFKLVDMLVNYTRIRYDNGKNSDNPLSNTSIEPVSLYYSL